MKRRNILIGLGVTAAGVGFGGTYALLQGPAHAKPTAPASILPQLADAGGMELFDDDRILGAADAPVTIIEYSSLTCPHCASFHTDTLPQIKAKYIDTGKVRLVIRDFPFDETALRAAMTAHCMPPERYFGFMEILFAKQAQWARAPVPLDSVAQLARLGGLSQQAFDTCQGDQELMDRLLRVRLESQNQFDIRSTPTFLINGEKLVGAQPYEEFEKMIEAALPDSAS